FATVARSFSIRSSGGAPEPAGERPTLPETRTRFLTPHSLPTWRATTRENRFNIAWKRKDRRQFRLSRSSQPIQLMISFPRTPAVSGPADGFSQLGRGRVALDALAQLDDLHVEGSRLGIVFQAPAAVEQGV